MRTARLGESTNLPRVKDLGSSETYVSRWVRRVDAEDGKRPSTSAADLCEARNRIRSLEQKNEILRRTAGYLGHGILPQ